MSLAKELRRVVDALQRTLFDDEPVDRAAPIAAFEAGPERSIRPVLPVAELRDVRVSWLGGERVAWRLKRSRRRSIGFVIGDEGLVVSAPNRTSLREIEAALQEKARWIQARLAEQRDRAARAEANRIVWRDGATIAFLGAPLRVRVDPRATQGNVQTQLETAGSDEMAVLRIGPPDGAFSPDRLRDAVEAWMKREALARFESRCRHFEPLLGVRAATVALSTAAMRWGSASANGRVCLHWRLIEFSPETIDYVVVHELAHLREMNHGPRFWKIVEAFVPDHLALRKHLREAQLVR